MKDETIRVGDLVMVVRGMPCCGAQTGSEGIPFLVTRVAPSHGECYSCKSPCNGLSHAEGLSAGGVDIPRLLKINPPAVDETVETSDELTV